MLLRKKSPTMTDLDPEFVESDSIWHPMEKDEDRVREQQLKKCLETLPEGQMQCIKGFFYDKQPYQELARQLQLEVKKIKSHIQNGKRNLKICMERHG